MAGAPILTGLPHTAWKSRGYDAETKRLEETRAQKRKALQELSDMHAAEGRSLGLDEWFDMARGVVGISGSLDGTAPTSTMLEAMHAQQNAKAAEAARQRKHKAMMDDLEADRLIESRAVQLARSGRSDVDIYDDLSKNWGAEVASKYKNRLRGIISNTELEDEQRGAMIGKQFFTEQQAEEEIKRRPGMTEAFYRGMRTAAKLNIMESEKIISQVALAVGQGGYVPDTPQARTMTSNMLPPFMRSEENVSRVMEVAKGIAQVKVGTDAYGVGRTAQTAMANWMPQAALTDARSYIEWNEKVHKDANAAAEEARRSHMESIAPAAKTLQTMATDKKRPNPMAAEALDIITTYSVDGAAQTRLVEAATSGDEEKFRAARAEALRMSVPLSVVVDAQTRVARVMAGELPGNSAEEQYRYLSSIGEGPAMSMMMQRGLAIADMRRQGMHESQVRAQIEGAVNRVVDTLLDDRQTLMRSGRFSASAQQLMDMELATAARQLQPLATAAGIPVAEMMAIVRKRLETSPPPTIQATPTYQDAYRGSVGAAYGNVGQPVPWQPGGGPQFVPPPNAALPQPSGQAPAQAVNDAPTGPGTVPSWYTPRTPAPEPQFPPGVPNTTRPLPQEMDTSFVLNGALAASQAAYMRAVQSGNREAAVRAQSDVRAILEEMRRLRIQPTVPLTLQ